MKSLYLPSLTIHQKFTKNYISSFDLTINNYFQTGILFFDTILIKINTKKEIINLANKFPISLTNEQGIMNLYFKFIYDYHDELPYDIDGKISYFYWKITGKNIIITNKMLSSINEKFIKFIMVQTC